MPKSAADGPPPIGDQVLSATSLARQGADQAGFVETDRGFFPDTRDWLMTLKSFMNGFGDVTAAFGDGRFAREMRRARTTNHADKGWEIAGSHLRHAIKEAQSEQEKQKGAARR